MAKGEPRLQRQSWRTTRLGRGHPWLCRRPEQLRRLIRSAEQLTWTPALLETLMEELYCDADDGVAAYLGDLKRLPRRRYPQAIAIALALRHSWRAQDFSAFNRRLASRGLVSDT